MLRYVETQITFAEVPDEISLCINISGCIIRCKDCHSKYLWDNIGKPLEGSTIISLIHRNIGMSCLCFMGGDNCPQYINELAEFTKELFPKVKVAWYSGREEISNKINLENFDYIKVGPYIKEKGPLNMETTNQRMYEIRHYNSNKLIDITYKFWKLKQNNNQ